MKHLSFDYDMQIHYSDMASSCHYTIKCFPTDTKRQRVENQKIMLTPDTDYCTGEDSFQNKQIYGAIRVPHHCFQFHISGNVTTKSHPFEEKADHNHIAIYRYPYRKNIPGDAIKAYYTKAAEDMPSNAYETSIFLMHRLYQDFAYEKGKTTMNTTAEEALKIGSGVCQDYAHIMTALLHLANIPARYVTGMMLGEGASHAWVEFLYKGKWFGIDPTNNHMVTDDYIRIGSGRDALDCLINRGIMHGGGTQTQLIHVCVTEQQDTGLRKE